MIPLVLFLALGCGSTAPPLSEEARFERLETNRDEHDAIKACLVSEDRKEVLKGLKKIHENPASFNLYREEVTRLNQTSKDPGIVQATTDLLARF